MKRELSWNLYSLGLIVLFSFFQIMQWPLLPKFLDTYYHLAVMKGFADAGGYVTHAFWEYAPAGRVHLYPPLLHVLMLLFYKLGFSPIGIARLVDVVSYPALLWALWHALSKIYSPKTAFIFLIVFSSVYSAYLSSVILTAFNLAFILSLFVFLNVQGEKPVAAGLWLGLCFYAHSFMGWLALFTVVLYGFLDREVLRSALKAALVGTLAAAPMLIFQFLNRHAYAFIPLHENRRLELDIFVYLLALGGLGFAFRKKGVYLFPVSLILGMLPLVFTYRVRYLSGHGLVGFALLATIFLEESGKWKAESGQRPIRFRSPLSALRFPFLILTLLFFSFLAPVLRLDLKEKKWQVLWHERTLTPYLMPQAVKSSHAQGFTIYFQAEYEEIVKWIREYSAPDDLLWSDFAHAGGMLSVLAGRATSSSMLAEVRPAGARDPMRDARVLVWFKNEKEEAPRGMGEAVQKYDLKLLAETGFAYVFQNPRSTGKRNIPKPVLPEALLFAILMGYGGFIIIASAAKP